MFSRLRTLGLIAALAIAPVAAHATPILGGSIVLSETSEVTVTFEGYSAAYTSHLYLDTPANVLGLLFTNHTTAVGTSVTLGTFAAGTELIFRLVVQNTGKTYYTGPASRNSDLVAHALIETIGELTTVGFEDLHGGGDKDYNDFKFSVTAKPVREVTTHTVPDSATTGLLLGLGLTGLAAMRRRLR